MIKPVFYIIFFLSVFSVKAQMNLVPNGSFEEYEYCPNFMDDFSVSLWVNPSSGASPNYLNSCGNWEASVPQNLWGYQYAHSGNAYAGFHTSDFSPISTNYREYIQIKLNSQMISGEKYYVSFFVSRADSSRRACDNIGIYFSENLIYSVTALNFPYSPQLKSEDNSPLTDNLNWVEVSGVITANGGEQFATIGVFANNNNLNWVDTDGGSSFGYEAYYFIDDVSVYQLGIIPNVITANQDGVNDYIDFSNFLYNVSIYDRWGNMVYSNQIKPIWDGSDFEGRILNDGVYFYHTEKKETGYIHLVR